jgi:hypothetical protein
MEEKATYAGDGGGVPVKLKGTKGSLLARSDDVADSLPLYPDLHN